MDYLPKMILLTLFFILLVWETVRPASRFGYGDGSSRLKHAARNLFLGAAGTAVSYVLFLPFWETVSLAAHDKGIGLLHLLESGYAVSGVAAIVLLDMWTYWWHRLNHRIRFLWRFHRVHHCDPWMDVTTAQRFHPGEIAISSLLRLPLIFILGLKVSHLAFYDVSVLSVVFLHHSNVSVPPSVDKVLRLIIPTPLMHKIHHSRYRPETDSNYSAMFSLWDRLFGSFRLRDEGAKAAFGLNGFDDPVKQQLAGLIRMPF